MDNITFVRFLRNLESFKLRAKVFHWTTDSKSVHELMDRLLSSLGKYQDSIVEDYLAYEDEVDFENLTNIRITDKYETVSTMINDIYCSVIAFYRDLPSGDINFVGIRAETEAFCHELRQILFLSYLE